MTPQKTLNAREAYTDCLNFFDQHIRPTMESPTRVGDDIIPGFKGGLIPLEGFEIKLTVTHGALFILKKHYPAADFEFHKERIPVPGADEQHRKSDPLNTLYLEMTISFTPYGTRTGGGYDDDGGNKTQGSIDEQQETISPSVPSLKPPTPNIKNGNEPTTPTAAV